MKNKWIVPAIIIAVGLFLLGQRIEQGIVRSFEGGCAYGLGKGFVGA